MKQPNKKILKKGVQKILETIIILWIFWICTTIDTIDSPLRFIKSYLVFTSLFTIITIISFVLLSKYSNVFEEDV